MDELLAVLENILSELEEMNSKLEEIKGISIYNSISNIYDKLERV